MTCLASRNPCARSPVELAVSLFEGAHVWSSHTPSRVRVIGRKAFWCWILASAGPVAAKRPRFFQRPWFADRALKRPPNTASRLEPTGGSAQERSPFALRPGAIGEPSKRPSYTIDAILFSLTLPAQSEVLNGSASEKACPAGD